jgi:hypothetical protein
MQVLVEIGESGKQALNFLKILLTFKILTSSSFAVSIEINL